MAYGVETDGHVSDGTNWAEIAAVDAGLIFWGKQDGISSLAESSPGIFEDVAFDQYPRSILEFKMVLDHEGITGWPTNKPGLPDHPCHGFEEMILADLDISRCGGCIAAAKKNVFRRSFQEIAGNAIDAVGSRAGATGYHMCVGTRS